MKTFLTSQDLWTLVSIGYIEPADENTYNALTTDQNLELKENRKKDEKAFFIIQTRIDISIFPKIAECTKSHDAWEILENYYKGSTKDRRIVEKVLRSLPRKFDPVTIATEELRDLSQLTLVDFLGSLKTHEDSMKLPLHLHHPLEMVESVEEIEEEEAVVEVEVTTMVGSTFIATIIIRMATLNNISSKRKGTPLMQILVKNKVRTLTIYFSLAITLKPRKNMYGILIVVVQTT
eukprot:Gb_02101 [translate_table: standard]